MVANGRFLEDQTTSNRMQPQGSTFGCFPPMRLRDAVYQNLAYFIGPQTQHISHSQRGSPTSTGAPSPNHCAGTRRLHP